MIFFPNGLCLISLFCLPSFYLPVLGLLLINSIAAQRPPYNGPGPQSLGHGGPQEKSKCALIVPGIQSPNTYSGGEACITYEAVNQAFNAALEELRIPAPKQKSLTDIDIDNLANVIVETTRILAKQYNLPRDAVYHGLQMIDTRRTVIDRYCPAYLKSPNCTVKRYREYNGMCNNLDNPHWGATLTPFRRLLPPAYADGISEPRISVSGEELPTARYVSTYNHRDLGYHDHAVTVFLIAWGQLIDHDMTLAGDSKDPATDAEPKCCEVAPDRRHPACWPVDIPSNDPFYSLFQRRCMNFVRTAAALKPNCKLGPRSQINLITSVLDANFIYGSGKDTADKLRTFQGGLLKSSPVHQESGLKDLLPLKLENPDAGCMRPTKDVYCFLAGDVRVNQQMLLVAMHTIMMREHNRIATELGQINPHWDDERIFQETRHIMAAVVQHITFNEFLPMVLGKDLMQRYGLLLQREGFANIYDPKVDPSLPEAFFAAAFRFGHSLLPSAIERWSVSHQYIGAKPLSEMLLRPFDLYQGGSCDQYLSGFMNQVSQAVDPAMTQELTNHLFQDQDKRWGSDLASLNLQRGRDHGVPSYNAFREYCGLPRARDWRDLSGAFQNDTLNNYADIYKTPDDIDLWSAGISERPLPGSMVGPTFGCIMGETFKNLRTGDRFWYENSGWPSSFTLDQLNEIRKVKLSRIVCDNGDNLESAQVYVMVLPDPEINPRVSCKSSVLPRINLNLWRDTDYRPGNNFETFNEYPTNSFFIPPSNQDSFALPPPSLERPQYEQAPPTSFFERPHPPQPPYAPPPLPAPPQMNKPHIPESVPSFQPSNNVGHPRPGKFRPSLGPFGDPVADPEPEPHPHPPPPPVVHPPRPRPRPHHSNLVGAMFGKFRG